MVRWIVVLSLAVAGVGACTLFDEDPPAAECMTDQDCFRAQGETCYRDTHQCGPRKMDAGIDAEYLDAPVDAEVDAQ